MRELLIGSLEAAMVVLKDQADLVGLENVDESTFRSFAMAAISAEVQIRESKQNGIASTFSLASVT